MLFSLTQAALRDSKGVVIIYGRGVGGILKIVGTQNLLYDILHIIGQNTALAPFPLQICLYCLTGLLFKPGISSTQ